MRDSKNPSEGIAINAPLGRVMCNSSPSLAKLILELVDQMKYDSDAPVDIILLTGDLVAH
jgi:hypothetical protein